MTTQIYKTLSSNRKLEIKKGLNSSSIEVKNDLILALLDETEIPEYLELVEEINTKRKAEINKNHLYFTVAQNLHKNPTHSFYGLTMLLQALCLSLENGYNSTYTDKNIEFLINLLHDLLKEKSEEDIRKKLNKALCLTKPRGAPNKSSANTMKIYKEFQQEIDAGYTHDVIKEKLACRHDVSESTIINQYYSAKSFEREELKKYLKAISDIDLDNPDEEITTEDLISTLSNLNKTEPALRLKHIHNIRRNLTLIKTIQSIK